MKKNVIIILMVFTSLISCGEKSVSNKIPLNTANPTPQDLKDIVEKGDTVAYKEIQTASIEIRDNMTYLYPYAKIMADKYKYTPAYYDVYACIRDNYTDIKNDNIISLNIPENLRIEAIKYLLHGVEKGDKMSMYELGKYYKIGRFFSRDTIVAQELQSKWP